MGVIIRNASGTAFSGGKIDGVTIKNTTKTTQMDLSGADADVVLKMGKNNREFTVKGFVTGSAGVSFLENALNGTGSFYFISEAMNNQVLVSTVVIFYRTLNWQDRGDRPMERSFVLDCVELK